MKIARVATSFLMAIVLLGIALYMSAIEYEYRLYMQQLHAETRLHGGLVIDYGPIIVPEPKPIIKQINGIPISYFAPPAKPKGGVESVLTGITDEDIGVVRIMEYMETYYPLTMLDDDKVKQLTDWQRAEYERQNDELDKDLLGPEYTLIKRVESLLRVPIAVLNILSKE